MECCTRFNGSSSKRNDVPTKLANTTTSTSKSSYIHQSSEKNWTADLGTTDLSSPADLVFALDIIDFLELKTLFCSSTEKKVHKRYFVTWHWGPLQFQSVTDIYTHIRACDDSLTFRMNFDAFLLFLINELFCPSNRLRKVPR